jgi:hypothetical protein
MVSDATVAKVSGRGKDVPSKLRIRCGRCRRIHQDVTEANYLRYPQSRRPCKVSRAAEMRPVEGLSIQLPAGMRMLETTPETGGRLRYQCHPKCGKTYPVSFANYTRAVEAAFDAGRGEILLGVDLG